MGVPSSNFIIEKYRKILAFGQRPIPDDLKAILDAGDISKRIGVKHKGKTDFIEASPKKAKKQRKTKSKKSKHAVVDEDS